MPNKEIIDEEEIFKSLSHKIRRNIIRIVGEKSELSFTDIKKQLDTIESIDSPSLSYHIKSLIPLIRLDEKSKKYYITNIGEAAYRLLLKTEQSENITRYKKQFLLAYVITHITWVAVQFLIPLFLYFFGGIPENYWVISIILVIATPINMSIVGYLRGYKE